MGIDYTDARQYETLYLLSENLKDKYRTFYNSKQLHVSIESLAADDSGKHKRIDVFWNPDRRLYDIYSDDNHDVFTSWTGDEDIDSTTLADTVTRLMEGK